MKEIRIVSMELQHFQGIKYFEATFEGKNARIYADNGVGKTTIANAISYVLLGKPVTEEKGFTPKTYGTHDLEHVVSVVFSFGNGESVKLTRNFHEVYKRARGSVKKVLQGHTVDHFINDVPCSEKNYNDYIKKEFGSSEDIMMLMFPEYFLSTMKVQDRRKFLIQHYGQMTFKEVINANEGLSEFSSILGEYNVDEYKVVVSKELKRIRDELDKLPSKIAEAQLAIPEEVLESKESLEGQLREVTQKMDELSLKKVSLQGDLKASKSYQSLVGEIQSLREEVVRKKVEYEQEYVVMNTERLEKLNQLYKIKAQAIECVEGLQKKYSTLNEQKFQMEKKRKQLLDEWQKVNTEEWTGDTICPTCGQAIPGEQIERAKENFNLKKSQRLEEIVEEGKKCSKELIDESEELMIAIKTMWQDACKKKDKLNDRIENLQVVGNKEDFETTDVYHQLDCQIKEKQTELEELELKNRELVAELEEQIKGYQVQIGELNQSLSLYAIRERQEERIMELKRKEEEYAQAYEDIQYGLYLCELFGRTQAELLDKKISDKFPNIRWRLSIIQQNGGIKEDCEALIYCEGLGYVPCAKVNHATRINAGICTINVIAETVCKQLPIIVDGAESVTELASSQAQVIALAVSENDKELRVELED
jgi:DNA repair exonuclease SbcCD ATPase subunit